jgi:hypothetical protein
MSIVALKLVFTEDHEVDYLGDIDEEELYMQAKDDKILFHRWYNWLQDRFFEHTGVIKPLDNFDERMNSENDVEEDIYRSLVENEPQFGRAATMQEKTLNCTLQPEGSPYDNDDLKGHNMSHNVVTFDLGNPNEDLRGPKVMVDNMDPGIQRSQS